MSFWIILSKIDCSFFIDREHIVRSFYRKVGDVMTTIRAEDDMALVSSTMARVFVNRWLLTTGCPSLVS